MPQQRGKRGKHDDQRQYLECDNQRRPGTVFQHERHFAAAGVPKHIA